MAATILDSLMIELGLDTSQFDRGAKEATRSLSKTSEEVRKSAEDIRKSVGQGISDAFQKATTRAVEFLAVLAGARSIEQFAVNVTAGATQLGIMASALGMAPERISAMTMAIERSGGSAEGTIATLRSLQNMRQQAKVTGQVSPDLMRLGVDVMGSKSPEDLLNRIIQGFQSTPWGRRLTDDQKITMLTTQFGFDPAVAAFYVRRGVSGAQSEMARSAPDAVTGAQVDAAAKLTDAWRGTSQALQSVGREIVRVISPAMVRLLGYVRRLIEDNRGALSDWFGEKFKAAVDWLTDPKNWAAARRTLDDYMNRVQYWVDQMGGWKNVGLALAGVFALKQISPILAAVAALTSAFVTLSGAVLFARGTGLATILAGLLVGYGVTQIDKDHPTSDEGARSKLRLRLHREPTEDEVRREKFIDENSSWWERGIFSDDLVEESLRGRSGRKIGSNVLSTTEGPVSEGRPLPVKFVGSTGAAVSPAPRPDPQSDSSNSSDPPADPKKESWWDWGKRMITGGGVKTSPSPPSTPSPAGSSPPPLPTTPAPAGSSPPSPPTPAPAGSSPPSPPTTPAPAKTGDYQRTVIDPYGVPSIEHSGEPFNGPPPAGFHVAPEKHSMGGAGVSAHQFAMAGSGRGSHSVQIAALNVHAGASPASATSDWLSERISRDFYALRSDVGLA